uniref:serine/threonine-protein phosphatase 7 long form homolog n=1 Tax=Erigeron canadensis TaxID=72917 RepID=UPI001CB91594|nr:serine/threonine-protein phosphatase 7 long form homolog [Erigeron canadensis]
MATNIQLRSEPLNGELLWLQGQHRHRSYAIFNDVPGSDVPLKARRSDKKLWDHIKGLPGKQINANVFRYIREAGFAGVFKTGFHHLDHGLVTALVERWRPETHTFHLPVGEATITLQDVQVLWGLPIDGPAICGLWESLDTYQWMSYCQQWLGFCPDDTEIKSGKIKITALIRQLEVDLEEDQEAYEKRARVYILALLGGHLFVDSGQNEVSLNFIQNIEDLSTQGRKSWGSAVLAYLYRNLCSIAEKPDGKGIQGALVLLQYWAWERMPHIAPTIKNGDTYNYEDCYACRWNYTMSFLNAPSHVVITFRAAFTALKNGQFRWTPYDEFIHLLPEDCRDGRQIWAYSGWLIFWSTVEPHLAHRVTRQFGWVQTIPRDFLLLTPQQHRELHDITRIGRTNTNWGDVHALYIAVWNRRHQMISPGTEGVMTTPDYMKWYYPRTVLFITNPGLPGRANQYPDWGATQQFYVEGMREIHNRAQQTSQRYPSSNPLMQEFMMMSEHIMSFGQNQDRISYGSQNFQFPPSAYHPTLIQFFPPPPPQL